METTALRPELAKKGMQSSRRLFLAALALVASALPGSVYASVMEDGPLVCSVDGSTRPTLINPDPLNNCPANGDLLRLTAGKDTADYLSRWYPNGPQVCPIVDTLAEDSGRSTLTTQP